VQVNCDHGTNVRNPSHVQAEMLHLSCIRVLSTEFYARVLRGHRKGPLCEKMRSMCTDVADKHNTYTVSQKSSHRLTLCNFVES